MKRLPKGKIRDFEQKNRTVTSFIIYYRIFGKMLHILKFSYHVLFEYLKLLFVKNMTVLKVLLFSC